MRRIISILFLMVMLVQAIPVLHFFSSQPSVFYTCIDEEKPTEKKETTGGQSVILPAVPDWFPATDGGPFCAYTPSRYTPPLLESMTPPPDCLFL